MIQSGTVLNVIDNSGAKEVRCIKVLGGYRRRYACIGDLIVVSVIALRTKRRMNTKVKKGEVLKALLVRTKTPLKDFSGGEYLNFFENSVVLLNNQNKPTGTRIFGSLPQKIRYTKHTRLASLSSGLIF
jgi:large subunit ribosomal protein L14